MHPTNPVLWNPKNTKVRIEISPDERPLKRGCSLARVKEICTSLFFQSMDFIFVLRNGPNVAKMQEAVVQRDSVLPKMELPFGSFYFANIPHITSSIFSASHRDGELFRIDNESKDSIFQLIYDMMGDPKLSPENLIFTCAKGTTPVFHSMLQKYLPNEEIDRLRPLISELVLRTLSEWQKDSAVDMTWEAHRLTCRVLCRVLLGVEDSEGKCAHAMKVFFDYISFRFLKKPIDMEEVKIAREDFWSHVNEGLEKGDGLAARLLQNEPTLRKNDIDWILFSLFFAGTDSTAGSLLYALLKLSQRPDICKTMQAAFQRNKELDNPFPGYEVACASQKIKKFLAEGLRMFTPVIGVSRIAREALDVQISYGSQTITRRVPKGALLLPSQNLAARCPMLFPEMPFSHEPGSFDPEIHGNVESLATLPWKPFGGGKHLCPGAYLYQTIAQILVGEIVGELKAELSTSSQREPEQTGHFINKLAEPVLMRFA